MEVGVIADDLTGAADTGIQLVRAGYRTAVAFREAPVPPLEELDVTVVDTDSRLIPENEARKRVREAGRSLASARMVYKKIDSTLRGSIAAELEAALKATGRPRAVVAPAFPSAGRSTERGVQLLYRKPLREAEPADDPHTPVEEDHVPSLLEAAGFGKVSTLGTEDLGDPETVLRVLGSAGCIVADAKEDEHLETLVKTVPDPTNVLWVGSAGLARALGSVYPGAREEAGSGAEPGEARRVLGVVGSTNAVVREQLSYLCKKSGVGDVPLDSATIAGGDSRKEIESVLEDAGRVLRSSREAVLYTTVEGGLGSDDARHLMGAVSEVVAGLSEEGLFDALVLTGGDTAVHVSRALGARGILLEKEVEAGVPLGNLIGPKPYPVVTKAGGFGNSGTLHTALRTLTGKG